MIRRANDRRRPTGKTSARSTKRRGRSRGREEVKEVIEAALRREFPHDTVDVSDGYMDNIHVLVVSRRFDDLNEQEKQELIWGLIDSTELSEDEKMLISLVLPLSPAQIK